MQVSWWFGDTQQFKPEGGPERAGQLFGAQYRVEALLGKGGMGVVYQARDLRLDREVAIKVLHTPLSKSAVARFLREGEVTASLDHPGIVRVHAGGVTAGGHPFLVLEMVREARDLGELFRTLPRGERIALMTEIARAVGHAHSRGIVHRDLKPANVLVDLAGRPLLCDFGLGWSQGLDRLTQTGSLFGTPSYAPPEQLSTQGRCVLPDPTADVWSLGVMLYEALTNRLPFEGATLYELLANVHHATPTRPREVVPDLPHQVERVALRALSRDPADRYADAATFAEALQSAVDEAALRVSRRAVIGAALVTGLSLLFAAVSQSSSPPPSAVTPRSTVPADSFLRDGNAAWAAMFESKATERLADAIAWLQRYPGHPKEAEVAETVAELEQRVPRLRLVHAGGPILVRACYSGDSLWTFGGQEARSWNLQTGDLQARVRLRSRAGRFAVRTAEEGIVLPVTGELCWLARGLVQRRERAVGMPPLHLFSAPSPNLFVSVGTSLVRSFPPETAVLRAKKGHRFLAAAARPGRLALASARGTKDRTDLVRQRASALSFHDLKTNTTSAPVGLFVHVSSMAYSPSGDTLAVGTQSGLVILYDSQGTEMRRLVRNSHSEGRDPIRGAAHPRSVSSLAFSSDGLRLHSISRGKRNTIVDPNLWITWDRNRSAPKTTLAGEGRPDRSFRKRITRSRKLKQAT